MIILLQEYVVSSAFTPHTKGVIRVAEGSRRYGLNVRADIQVPRDSLGIVAPPPKRAHHVVTDPKCPVKHGSVLRF